MGKNVVVEGKQYQFRPGSRFKVSPQDAGEELERIAEENGGVLKPRTVAEESRPEEATLHDEFEWDDERAADLYRDDQARHLIRCIEVFDAPGEDESEAEARIAFVSVLTEGEEGQGYVDIRTVMTDPGLSAQALHDALAQLRGLKRRYASLKQLSGVWAAIDALDS